MARPRKGDPAPAARAAAPRTAAGAQRRAPASAKSEQRVRDILRVGREVFSERGYERSTTTEIAQRLGVSEATVFTYFRGKRELCVRVIADWYDEITAAIEHGLPRDQPVRAQFDFFVHAHLRLFLGHGTGMCALVLSEGRDKGPDDLGDAVLPLHRRYTAPLMDLLARGQADGVIRSDVPLRLLRSLVLGPMEHLLWETVASIKERRAAPEFLDPRGAEPGHEGSSGPFVPGKGLAARGQRALQGRAGSRPGPGGTRHSIDIDAQARAMSMLLWSALAAPGAEVAALRTLRDEVVRSLDRAARV